MERTDNNSASYIQEWLKQLRNDTSLVVQAAAQAQKAADFILDVHSSGNGDTGGGK
jgi:antirestriction protein ArdC